jgi:phage tail-like protein
MATAERKDPFNNFNFHVEIGGISRAAFHECSGLDSTIDIIEHREGGKNETLHKLPGQTKYSNIVLKRGITDDRALYDWHFRAINGALERVTGSIVLYDRQGTEVARWNFEQAWPCKWTGPSLSAEGNDVAIEQLDLAHEGINRVK